VDLKASEEMNGYLFDIYSFARKELRDFEICNPETKTIMEILLLAV
jgi:hypothetical protein